jgi:hypothetical protein
MEHTNSQRILRQLFLIRYTSLIERIRDKLSLSQEITEILVKAIVKVDWIDETLDEVKALPVT